MQWKLCWNIDILSLSVIVISIFLFFFKWCSLHWIVQVFYNIRYAGFSTNIRWYCLFCINHNHRRKSRLLHIAYITIWFQANFDTVEIEQVKCLFLSGNPFDPTTNNTLTWQHKMLNKYSKTHIVSNQHGYWFSACYYPNSYSIIENCIHHKSGIFP